MHAGVEISDINWSGLVLERDHLQKGKRGRLCFHEGQGCASLTHFPSPRFLHFLTPETVSFADWFIIVEWYDYATQYQVVVECDPGSWFESAVARGFEVAHIVCHPPAAPAGAAGGGRCKSISMPLYQTNHFDKLITSYWRTKAIFHKETFQCNVSKIYYITQSIVIITCLAPKFSPIHMV